MTILFVAHEFEIIADNASERSASNLSLRILLTGIERFLRIIHGIIDLNSLR